MSILAEKVKECIDNNVAITLTPDEAKQFYAEFEQEYLEYKQRAEAAEAKLRELEMQEPVAYLVHIGIPTLSWKSLDKRRDVPLYAKPFPAPKQEEK